MTRVSRDVVSNSLSARPLPPGATVRERRAKSRPLDGADGFAGQFRPWAAPVHDLVSRLIRDPEVASEVGRQTYLLAETLAPSLSDRSLFGAWVLSLARGLAVDRLQRDGTDPLQWLGLPPDADPAWLLARVSGTGSEARGASVAHIAWGGIRTMPVEDASVVLLAVRHGVTLPELAAALGASVPAADAARAQALRRFAGACAAGLIWNDGDPECRDLGGLLVADDRPPFSGRLARRVVDHAIRCEGCRRRLTGLAGVLDALVVTPMLAAPAAMVAPSAPPAPEPVAEPAGVALPEPVPLSIGIPPLPDVVPAAIPAVGTAAVPESSPGAAAAAATVLVAAAVASAAEPEPRAAAQDPAQPTGAAADESAPLAPALTDPTSATAASAAEPEPGPEPTTADGPPEPVTLVPPPPAGGPAAAAPAVAPPPGAPPPPPRAGGGPGRPARPRPSRWPSTKRLPHNSPPPAPAFRRSVRPGLPPSRVRRTQPRAASAFPRPPGRASPERRRPPPPRTRPRRHRPRSPASARPWRRRWRAHCSHPLPPAPFRPSRRPRPRGTSPRARLPAGRLARRRPPDRNRAAARRRQSRRRRSAPPLPGPRANWSSS